MSETPVYEPSEESSPDQQAKDFFLEMMDTARNRLGIESYGEEHIALVVTSALITKSIKMNDWMNNPDLIQFSNSTEALSEASPDVKSLIPRETEMSTSEMFNVMGIDKEDENALEIAVARLNNAGITVEKAVKREHDEEVRYAKLLPNASQDEIIEFLKF